MDTLRPRSTPRGFPRIPPLPPLGYLHNFHSDLSHIVTPGTTGAFPETNCSRNSDCRTLSPAEEQRGANRFPRAMVRKIAGSIRRPVGSGRGGEAAEFFHKQIIEPPQRRFQIHPCLRELGSSCGITCSNPPPPRTSRRARRLGGGGARTLRCCRRTDEPSNDRADDCVEHKAVHRIL
jgi:hypothetical protein